ncbi:protein MAIN-LIKE 1 isoform X2 [Beta vulgaris subsp. vulgaris]|uniref:protein MAIN-LIKE 1 isoform X2 n=1 Tax=Beta vulgaris subsp. vulgaris TaxID=3555 RepID=UPI002036C73E|nr:protein MAIN-LIKE 1 isoform X2 [Beta vulgaris subsp. vulgaris]
MLLLLGRIKVGNFTTKFSMSSFVKKVEELTHEQRTAIERVGFGNLLHVHHHTLRKNLLVEWMERWDCDKRAFLLHDRELTITAIDAALILGLRATGNPICFTDEDPLSVLEEEYGATYSNRKISMSAIERRLQSLGDQCNEDFVRTFLLFIFGTILFPGSNGKIDSRYVSLLKDLDGVSEFSWGTAVVDDLFNWLSRRKEEQTKSMEGCLILLQIWSYEHIDIGRPNLLSSSLDFPRACRWESSRCNIPRHWFTAKFNELEENQVTWKLQPSDTDIDIDIVRELVVEKAELEDIKSTGTATTTSMTAKVPSKHFSQNVVLDEEPEGGVGRGKHDQQADVPENSRQSADASVITEDYTECSSSSSLHEDQNAETSHRVEGERVYDNKKLKSDGVVELRREISALKRQLTRLSLIPKLEEEIANLRKELADVKEDNQRLRAPSPADNIERLINEYFDGVSDASDVFCLR